MRYEDWDVLLFPSAERDDGRPPVPIREFKVACQVVPDNEITLAHGTLDLPVVTCCIPGLEADVPFTISIHCWEKPAYSQFTRNCTTANDRVRFQARVFVDGRLTSSVSFGRGGPWPLQISQSQCLNTPEVRDLEFPAFRPDLLQTRSWAPNEDLGRIKIILSEGFASTDARPFVRVKNILAFSFQHAPLDVLETHGIAWPNPVMWRQAAVGCAPPRPPIESHGHSPRTIDFYPRRLARSVACGLPVSPGLETVQGRRGWDRSSSHSTPSTVCERDHMSPCRERRRMCQSDASMPDFNPMCCEPEHSLAASGSTLYVAARGSSRGHRRGHRSEDGCVFCTAEKTMVPIAPAGSNSTLRNHTTAAGSIFGDPLSLKSGRHSAAKPRKRLRNYGEGDSSSGSSMGHNGGKDLDPSSGEESPKLETDETVLAFASQAEEEIL